MTNKTMVVACCQCSEKLDEATQAIYRSPLDDAPYCEYCSPENGPVIAECHDPRHGEPCPHYEGKPCAACLEECDPKYLARVEGSRDE